MDKNNKKGILIFSLMILALAIFSIIVIASPYALPDTATTTEGNAVNIDVLANDAPQGTISIIHVGNALHGTTSMTPSIITYTPNIGFSGIDTFAYSIRDDIGNENATFVTINVTDINHAPQPANDIVNTTKNVAVNFNPLVNDIDVDGDSLQISSVANPSNGIITSYTAIRIYYTPNPGFTGTDTFAYTVNDSQGASGTAYITVNINGNNSAPVAVADSATAIQGVPTTINVLANDNDPENDALTISSVSSGIDGATSTNGTVVNYTSNVSFSGLDSFGYVISDGNGHTASAVVTVNVTAIVKIASTCSLTFNPASPSTYGIGVNASCNCTNPQASAVLYRNGTDVTATENNIATSLAAGDYAYVCNVTATQNYTSAQNYSTYIINKANSTVNLTLNGNDADATVVAGTFVNISAYLITPASGYIELRQNGTLINSGSNNFLTNYTQYTAPAVYNLTVIYPATQNYSTSSKTHILTITNATAPNITIDYASTPINESNIFVLNFTVTANYVNDNVTYTIRRNGIVVNTSTLTANYSISYQWQTDYESAGTYNFSIVVNDTTGLNDVEYGTIVVNNTPNVVINEFDSNPADPPDNEWFELYNPTANATNLNGWTISDSGGSSDTFPNIVIPAGGYIVIDEGFIGFGLTLNDANENLTLRDANGLLIDTTPTKDDSNHSLCWDRIPNGVDTENIADWTFKICTFNQSNDADMVPPVVTLISPLNNSNLTNRTVTFSYNVTDNNATTLNCTLYHDIPSWQANSTQTTANGATNTFTIDLQDGAHAWNVLCIDQNNNNAFAPANFTFNLNQNDAPVLDPIANYSVSEDSLLAFNLTATDADIPYGDNLTFTTNNSNITITNFNQTLSTLSWTPDNSFVGNNSVLITVTDIFGLTDSRVILIQVNNTNDAPFFNPLLANQVTPENSLFTYDIDASDVDAGDVLLYSTNATEFAINSTTGLISFTPLVSGIISVNATVCDNSAAANNCTSGVFTINVTEVNDNPLVNFTPLGTVAMLEDSSDASTNLSLYITDEEDLPSLINWSCTTNDSNVVALANNLTKMLNITASNNFYGTVNVTCTAIDTLGGTGIGSFLVNVANTNDAPTLSTSIPNQTWQTNTNRTINLSQYFTDIDPADSLSYTSTQPSNITVSIDNSTGIATLIPDNNWMNTTSIIFTALDLAGLSANSNNVTLTVTDIPSRVINSNINSTFYPGDNVYTNLTGITRSTINISTINGPSYSIIDSIILNSTILDGAVINNCNISNSIYGGICDPSNIVGSDVDGTSAVYDSTVINSNILNNSHVNLSRVYDATLINTNVTNAFINGSIIRNSVLTDSNSTGNSNITNSQISQNSVITSSTVNNSTIQNSGVTNSTVNTSTVINSTFSLATITNVTAINSTITNSTLNNVNATNAVITNGAIISGNITLPNGTTYNGGTNLTDIINYAPTAVISPTSASGTDSLTVNFNGLSSTDPNIPGSLGDSLNYSWDFDSSNGIQVDATGNTTSHTYGIGTFTATLTVTDSFGLSSTSTTTIIVSAGGNGGSSGGGSSYSGTTYTINLTNGPVTKVLRRSDRVKFTFQQEDHYVRLNDLYSGSVDITVQSTPKRSIVSLGQTNNFDITGDLKNDISVTLTSLSSPTAALTFALVKESTITQTNVTTPTTPKEEVQEQTTQPKEDTSTTEWVKLKKSAKANETIVEPQSTFVGKAYSFLKTNIKRIPYVEYIFAGIAILIILIVILNFKTDETEEIEEEDFEEEKPKKKSKKKKR
jgi:hypothetical protein